MSHQWIGERVRLENKDRMKPKGLIEWPKGVQKLGAGLLLCNRNRDTDEVDIFLLLRSRKSGNPLTWGLPGGNVDKEDESLLDCAKREAREEVGRLPDFEVKKEVCTMRGKMSQKWYTVFICMMTSEQRDIFKPTLNKEHVDFNWHCIDKIAKLPLHKVLCKLFTDLSIDDLKNVIV